MTKVAWQSVIVLCLAVGTAAAGPIDSDQTGPAFPSLPTSATASPKEHRGDAIPVESATAPGKLQLTSLTEVDTPDDEASVDDNPVIDGSLLACRECACVAGPRGHWSAGAGLYIIKPFFENNPAYSAFTQGAGPGVRRDIKQRTAAAPLFWLGYQTPSGLGARTRWWFFDQRTDETFAFTSAPGQTVTILAAAPLGATIIQNNAQAINVSSKLRLHVVDLEAYDELDLGRWNLLLAGGIGYANIAQGYGAQQTLASGQLSNPLSSDSYFTGLGPVLALEARRRLGCRGLKLYGSARGRFVYGSAGQTVTGGDELNGSQSLHRLTLVSIGELEIGVEYDRRIACRRWFGQVALVGQEWIGGGNASGSSRTNVPTTIPVFSTDSVGNFGFFGAVVRLGVEF
ncbi:hypothetical protein Pan216_03330 [Planctomycetes bacterium Pan216]|uniref:Uncharacterized protein n=1 Tax=Kolteria novifilia TaxID=2527975 RepID=A0A518AXR8_9BACT|nr:hypothetical protein Pan216_03330 [Planctomycetes bacterium Pan216]